MTIRYLLVPGTVRSRSDGQRHHIGAVQLARLYRVNPDECVVWSDHPAFLDSVPRLLSLYPLDSGNYKEALESSRIDWFNQYVKHRKLLVMRQDRRWKTDKAYIERHKKVIADCERVFPEFVEAYVKTEKR